jgi:hypothetical protein
MACRVSRFAFYSSLHYFSFDLTRRLHQEGINNRFLGYIRGLIVTNVPVRQLVRYLISVTFI